MLALSAVGPANTPPKGPAHDFTAKSFATFSRTHVLMDACALLVEQNIGRVIDIKLTITAQTRRAGVERLKAQVAGKG